MSFGVNDFAAHVLKAIRNGAEFPFPCMYQSQLRKINLDFSLQSLEHIDELLFNIRKQLKPSYEVLVNSQEGQIFLNVVTIYAMSTIAKAGGYTVKWFNYDEFKAMVPADNPPEFCFEATSICIIQGAIRLPLGVVIDVLFKSPIGLGFVNYANQFLKESSEYFELYTEIDKISLSDDLILKYESLVNLSEYMGLLVAGTIAHAPASNFGVTLLAPSIEEERPIVKFIKFMDSDASELRNHLDNNPRQKEWLSGVFDGYVYPYSGKTDALILEAKNYTGHAKIKINMLLPYSYNEESEVFSFSKPLLLGSHWSNTEIKIISKSVLKQIHQMPIALEAWRKYYQENTEAASLPLEAETEKLKDTPTTSKKRPWYKPW